MTDLALRRELKPIGVVSLAFCARYPAPDGGWLASVGAQAALGVVFYRGADIDQTPPWTPPPPGLF